MVADGYWLRTPDTTWRRVTLADYIEAMQTAGFRVEPPVGAIGYGGRVRDFKADGIRGTVADPHSQPARETPRMAAAGRTLTPEQAAQFRDSVGEAFQPLVSAAAQFLQQLVTVLGPALAELNRMLRDLQVEREKAWRTPTGTTPPSGGPSPTPTGLESPSKPASDADNPTGTTSTGSSTG